eukprot:1159031-Pelagomonas_calceolata.AAC.6
MNTPRCTEALKHTCSQQQGAFSPMPPSSGSEGKPAGKNFMQKETCIEESTIKKGSSCPSQLTRQTGLKH